MDPIMIAIGLLGGVLSIWFGSFEIRLRNMDEKLRDVPSRKEVSTEIKVRQESIKVLQQEIKEDIRLMRRQLEKLIDK